MTVTLAAIALVACGSATEPAGQSSTPAAATSAPASASPGPSDTGDASASATPTRPGVFITLDDYEADPSAYDSGDVVLFFNASWCSTCKVARDNLTSDPEAIPAGLTIVSVDFDSATDLRQRYGVTLQHTYVQVGPDGSALATWSGSVTAEEIAENTV